MNCNIFLEIEVVKGVETHRLRNTQEADMETAGWGLRTRSFTARWLTGNLALCLCVWEESLTYFMPTLF